MSTATKDAGAASGMRRLLGMLLAIVVIAACGDSDESPPSPSPPPSIEEPAPSLTPDEAPSPEAEAEAEPEAEPSPEPEPTPPTTVEGAVLTAGEPYSVMQIGPAQLGDDHEREPIRIFVVLRREPDRAAYVDEAVQWEFPMWSATYDVRRARRPAAPEPVTIVMPGRPTCVARGKALHLLEQPGPLYLDDTHARFREALELDGCAFENHLLSVPIAIAGEHPAAKRVSVTARHAEAAAERELRAYGISESGPRSRPTLRGLHVESYASEALRVVTVSRPSDEVWSGEVHSNDADQGETAYVLHHGRQIATLPFLRGDSLISVDERRFLVLQSAMMNTSSTRVFEWNGESLLPALEICAEQYATYLNERCHRPFEAGSDP